MELKASVGYDDGIEKATRIKIETVIPPEMSITLTVEGMSCEHCEQTVTEALSGVAGVENVAVDRADERATVEGDTDTDALVAAVEDAGYNASA